MRKNLNLLFIGFLMLFLITGCGISDYTQVFVPGAMRIVFTEDFSKNPDSNEKWRVYLKGSNASTRWDSETKVMYLTHDKTGSSIAIFANYKLLSHSWKASFRYKVGGQSNCICGNCGADGFVFMFYKEENDYSPSGGGSEGFNGQGYGIEFDNYPNNNPCDPGTDPSGRHVALITAAPRSHHHLAYANDERVEDDKWHKVIIGFKNGQVSVQVDKEVLIDYQLSNPDYTYSGIGFSASTGAASNYHIIDDFMLRVQCNQCRHP